MPFFADNRKARFDYEILETFEAGIVLSGAEAKSVRGGRLKLTGAFATLHAGELFLTNANIASWQPNNAAAAFVTDRSRKLLIKKKELSRLIGKMKESGLTIVPLESHESHGKIKIQLGLGRGRKAHDKRDVIRTREVNREIGRAMRGKPIRGKDE